MTSIVPCKSCGRDIVFLRTRSGKLMPVDAQTVMHGDTQFDAERHISHFSNCPQAREHRRGRA